MKLHISAMQHSAKKNIVQRYTMKRSLETDIYLQPQQTSHLTSITCNGKMGHRCCKTRNDCCLRAEAILQALITALCTRRIETTLLTWNFIRVACPIWMASDISRRLVSGILCLWFTALDLCFCLASKYLL